MDYYDNPTEVTVGGAGNLPATNELPVDMHSKLYEAYPALTPVLTMLTRLSETGSSNFRIDWQEAGKIPTAVVVGNALTSGATALTVIANALTLVRETLLFNPRTFDMAQVNTVSPTSDTAATIIRDIGGTTGAAWIAGDVLHVLPPSVPENDDEVYRNVSVADTNVFNFMQLIRMQFAITRIMDKTATHFGGAGWKRNQLKAQKFREFKEKWEKMIYFGGRSSTGTAPSSSRYAGGFVHYLRNGTLYKDFNGVFTESGFDNFLGDYHDQNPDATNINYFAAGNVIRQINYFAKDKVRISPQSKTFGLDITTYMGGPLKVNLIELPLLHDPQTRGWGFLLDMDRIMLKTIDRTKFIPDAKGVGQSELIYDTYRAAASLMLATESRHAMSVGALL